MGCTGCVTCKNSRKDNDESNFCALSFFYVILTKFCTLFMTRIDDTYVHRDVANFFGLYNPVPLRCIDSETQSVTRSALFIPLIVYWSPIVHPQWLGIPWKPLETSVKTNSDHSRGPITMTVDHPFSAPTTICAMLRSCRGCCLIGLYSYYNLQLFGTGPNSSFLSLSILWAVYLSSLVEAIDHTCLF